MNIKLEYNAGFIVFFILPLFTFCVGIGAGWEDLSRDVGDSLAADDGTL